MKEESTIIRIVKDGDTLPQLSQEIYNSKDYYVQVAKYNKLNKFRDLTPGMQLIFPPIVNLDTDPD